MVEIETKMMNLDYWIKLVVMMVMNSWVQAQLYRALKVKALSMVERERFSEFVRFKMRSEQSYNR